MTWNWQETVIQPLVGGALIGVAVSLMLWWNGRVTGISGIASGILARTKGDTAWRIAFILGLVSGGVILNLIAPQALENTSDRGLGMIIAAGLVVGFGTTMGSGCTSGHGVCGISRFSIRSLVATGAFMATGFLTVFIINSLNR